MDIKIVPYENWMKPQIIQLFCHQYKVEEKPFLAFFENLYEHPFQKEKAICMAAQYGERIIGFQSLFYWPYYYNGKKQNSYQSGNSLVDPEFRGKRIFNKLIIAAEQKASELNVDLIMGFPIEVSLKSFLRMDWKNILDLQWYLKINNLFFLFYALKEEKITNIFSTESKFTELGLQDAATSTYKLSNEIDFQLWRKSFAVNKNNYFFFFVENGQSFEIEFKIVKRKKVINEIILGNINTTSYDPVFLEKVFESFLLNVKKLKFIGFISMAINTFANYSLLPYLKKAGFKEINKKIHFIVKPTLDSKTNVLPENWILYRSDIDTW